MNKKLITLLALSCVVFNACGDVGSSDTVTNTNLDQSSGGQVCKKIEERCEPAMDGFVVGIYCDNELQGTPTFYASTAAPVSCDSINPDSVRN